MSLAEEAPKASKLLYIDDDQALCYLVKKGLERRGYAVSTAHSGREGVAMAAAEPFDLIAIDHYMPGQDGLATLGDLRGLEAPPPVVYVTGSDESRIAVAALKEGAIDYVVKTGSEDFIDLLTSALRQAEQRLRLRQERDAAMEALRAANARLESIVDHQKVLLREVNHRVANSLQLVSSLVHMQISALGDPAAREALRDTQARIDAIMQIHRRLYTSENVQVVDMRDYLDGLVEELRATLTAGDGRRTIALDAAPISLPTDSAVSLGVIVAELVTNACKYAYVKDQPGEVRVVLQPFGEAGCRLVVEDDGTGFSPSEPAKGTGLGRTVITAMAKNLASRVAYDPAHAGARAVLEIGV